MKCGGGDIYEKDIRKSYPVLTKGIDLIDAVKNYKQKLEMVVVLSEEIDTSVAEVWMEYYASPILLHIDFVYESEDFDILEYINGSEYTTFAIISNEDKVYNIGDINVESNMLYSVD